MLALLALGWSLGLLLSPLVGDPAALAVGVASLLLSGVLVTYGAELRAGLWALPLCLAGLAAGLGHRAPPPPEPLAPGVVRVTAEVTATRFRGGRAIATAVVVEGTHVADGAPVRVGAPIDIYGADVPNGARVRAIGRLGPPLRYRNPSPHPPWPRSAHVAGSLFLAEGSTVAVESAPATARLLHGVRRAVRGALARTLSSDAAGLNAALVLGDGGTLEDDDQDAVRTLGLSHVLAVSGLHVVIVAGLAMVALEVLFLALGLFGDPRRPAAAAAIPLTFVYAAFAGAEPSAIRAALTAGIGYGLIVAGRRPSAIAVLGAAVCVQASLAPTDAHHPGFLLSVLATAALITAPRATGEDIVAAMRSAAALSLRATVATAPLIVWLFGQLPLFGVLANVLLVPLGVILVPLSLAHGLIAAAIPALGAWTAPAVEILSGAFLVSCRALAFDETNVVLPPLSVFQGIALSVACALFLVPHLRTRLWALAGLCLALAAGEAQLRTAEKPTGELRVTILDVGQGDAALVDFPDGRAMLIDAGRDAPDVGARVLVPLLEARRRDRLDVVVITHPHPDHYGGLPSVLAKIEVGELWDTGQAESESGEEGEGAAAALLASARTAGARIVGPGALCGRPRAFGAAAVEVLTPCPRHDPGLGANDNSLALRISMGSRRLLFVGDLEAQGEARLLARGVPLGADFLKVGHHGSRTSSGEDFLRAVAPRFASISAGLFNRYGHPHPEPLAALEGAGIEVLRTDLHGGITVVTDGRALSVTPFVEDVGRPPAQ